MTATNPYYGATLAVDEGRWAKTFDVNLRGQPGCHRHKFRTGPGM